ncbi:TAF6-like RNA polymerase II p300/CBP-associated factor-associated factor 65 kDa subunit 6L [Asbolus verrucosus]|uniref:TAF6-like RNA polymerase II p300/CBP-associated factor-associated factor 65 kDa subunit 6L n=1 Tax=Asbolus verrucosus TaxID=1661398 RepID=A0A482VQP9_ASBVE|nr:TAF6-like RNA polymerase II p300/CBP-associated factor-associated factor 65 kDa subunit 6L [Asbolus verrucosus]
MKPTAQSAKSGSSNSKSKKTSKEREKRKSQGGSVDVNNHNPSEKGSPTKESGARLYAGIDADSLAIYAEQTAIEHLSEEITNTLTEDINYRLRYIINVKFIVIVRKLRLIGRNAISSNDLEQTFENLKIDKVYGAPSHPNWVPFGYQNLYYLDDKEVNLVEIAQEENVYYQYSDTIISTKWVPEQKEISKSHKNYFMTMCQMVVSNDAEMRKVALNNISQNPRIGPIIEWFYNFSYILLSKDITYDCLTLRALGLLEVLENSPMCRMNVSEKQLKLLVRLILQRLLKSPTNHEILKPICNVLTILCQRTPLKDFVILKISQKLNEVFENYALPVITIINSLNIDAIMSIFLPNVDLFLKRITKKNEPLYVHCILELYYILHKERLIDSSIYDAFFELFGDCLVIFNNPIMPQLKVLEKREIHFAHVKHELLRARRRISPRFSHRTPIEDVFEMPSGSSKIRKKLDSYKWNNETRQTDIVIGKTSLLLPVFKRKKVKCSKCHDHTLLSYNL